MSDEEFEVKGVHEEAVEHAAQHHALGQQIALFSAVLATLGAIVSFLGGHTQNEALYFKNEAVLMKARASDKWAYFQAESTKEHIAEVAADLSTADAAKYRLEAARHDAKKKRLEMEGKAFDKLSDDADMESRRALAPHSKLAISMTFLQIAIALASISALTRRRWLLWGAGLTALIGIALGGFAWL